MKISIVIPNFNGRVLLEKNLPKVIGNSPHCEIIVVDDASDDDSVNFLRKNYPEIKLNVKKTNTGFSSTVNEGVRSANGDLIILFNTDIYPKKDYLAPLMPYFNDPDTFAVGMLQECLEEGKKVMRGRGIGKFEKGFLMHSRGGLGRNDTLWVSGGAGIFRKSIWEKLGGLCELYDPFYWEDLDLSYRAVKSGYKIFFEQKSTVVHEQETGSIRSKYSKSEILTVAYRNQFYFVWLNISNTRYLLAHLIGTFIYIIKFSVKFDFLYITGLLKALKNFGNIRKIRKINRMLWSLDDGYLLDGKNLIRNVRDR